jgi:hypothetical protein
MALFDSWALTAGILSACLALGVVVLAILREGALAAARWVICPLHQRGVIVEFAERMEAGVTQRTVRYCPLRGRGQPCAEDCIEQFARPAPQAPS